MGKPFRRDLRSLLRVPHDDLQVQAAQRLARRGFPALRPAHVQLLSSIQAAILTGEVDGVRLSDLVLALSLPKQTVGDLVDDLESAGLVERVADPTHGVIKRVRLSARGRTWATEVRRVGAATEARWATKLGVAKMKSLRALLEELATAVESGHRPTAPTASSKPARRRRS